MRIWAVAAIIALPLPVIAIGQAAPDKPTKSVRITGRVVSEQGNPVQDLVIVTRIEDDVLLADRVIAAASDGSFTFVSEPGRKFSSTPGSNGVFLMRYPIHLHYHLLLL